MNSIDSNLDAIFYKHSALIEDLTQANGILGNVPRKGIPVDKMKNWFKSLFPDQLHMKMMILSKV